MKTYASYNEIAEKAKIENPELGWLATESGLNTDRSIEVSELALLPAKWRSKYGSEISEANQPDHERLIAAVEAVVALAMEYRVSHITIADLP